MIYRGMHCRDGSQGSQDAHIINEIYGDMYRTNICSFGGRKHVAVDVGAHIGGFSKLWHEKEPNAEIYCIEACPENIDLLRANVGSFATVIHASCTYDVKKNRLLNSVAFISTSTGGSIACSEEELMACTDGQYIKDHRIFETITLHELMDRYNLQRIDMLKLDCEASEFSILEHGPLDNIDTIVVESHGAARWRDLLQRKFNGWEIGHMSSAGNFEIWHLANRKVVSRNQFR